MKKDSPPTTIKVVPLASLQQSTQTLLSKVKANVLVMLTK
jgi:hypothetical protein